MLDRLLSFDLGSGPEIWIAAGLAVVIAVLFIRSRGNQLRIPKLRAMPDAALPDCMAVIPARNEEGFVGKAVASLPHDFVIVVDDGSDDRTAEEAEENGAGVIKAEKIPRGAYGKSIACATGARALTSRWVLFADADTHFAPGFPQAAIAAAEASGIAYLSVYLDQEYRTLVEYALAPYLTALFFCGNDPISDPAGAFNGQCMLLRRDAYEFLGGHGAVATHLNEDVRLAMVAQRHRLKFGIARANHLGFARIRDLGGMVRRGACRFMIGNPGGGIAILLAALLMAAWVPIVVLLWQAHDVRPAIALGVLPFLVTLRWYGRGKGLLAVLLLPVAVYAALPLLASGMWVALAGSSTHWKGRN